MISFDEWWALQGERHTAGLEPRSIARTAWNACAREGEYENRVLFANDAKGLFEAIIGGWHSGRITAAEAIGMLKEYDLLSLKVLEEAGYGR